MSRLISSSGHGLQVRDIHLCGFTFGMLPTMEASCLRFPVLAILTRLSPRLIIEAATSGSSRLSLERRAISVVRASVAVKALAAAVVAAGGAGAIILSSVDDKLPPQHDKAGIHSHADDLVHARRP